MQLNIFFSLWLYNQVETGRDNLDEFRNRKNLLLEEYPKVESKIQVS